MKKYTTIFWMMFKVSTYERGQLFVSVLLWGVRMSLLVGVYAVAYRVSTESLSLTFDESIWSMGLYFIVMGFFARGIYRRIISDVQTGAIELFLVRPVHYLLHVTCLQIGKNIFAGIVLAIFLVILLVIVGGVPVQIIDPVWWLFLVLFFFIGNIIALMMYGLVGLLAVWMEDSSPVYWVVDKFVMILGGAYMPIALLPSWIQGITEYSPFGAVNYITWLARPDWLDHALRLLSMQLLWVVIFMIVLKFVWSRVEKELFVNGG